MNKQITTPHYSEKKLLTVIALVCLVLSITATVHADLCMWEIQDCHNKAFLLGSIHLMPENAYPLDSTIEEAFGGSDVLVVELDATTLNQNVINNFIGLNAIYRDSTNLQSRLDEALFDSLVTDFAELGLNEQQLNMFKPWFVSLNLGMGALQKIDIETGLGIDMHFLNQAHEKEMEIIELEEATSQLEAISSMDEDTQIDFLEYAVDEFDNAGENFNEMLVAWQEGDTEKLNSISKEKILSMEEEMPGMKDYYDKMFTQREEEMTKEIIELVENEEAHTYFIIVGAFHLVGDDGLIVRLQDKGYTLKQLETEGSDEKK